MPARVYGGFGAVPSGMDGGRSPSLLPADQYALGINTSVNGSLLTARPSWRQHALTFSDATTQANFTGKYQGDEFYRSDFGRSGWVISVAGHLFFVNTSYIVTEITPKLTITTTQSFVVPGVGSSVNIFVSSESPLSVGEFIFIDSGQYQVTNLFTNEISAIYAGGAANATAAAGNGVTDQNGNTIFEYQSNPADYDFVYMFQAEFYMIILGGQHKTIIFDGSVARQAAQDEIPPGILGAYGWGRIWICLDDRRSFVAGNLCFDTQGGGTQQYNFRDSILKFTDNTFLNGGGTFGVPINAGFITSMQFLATQDTSLGVGVLLVGTDGGSVFSVNAPVDRTTWQNLTYPIQTVSLIGAGPKGPRSTIPVNQDMWFRWRDGLRSFVVARRYMNQPGNIPMSREVNDVLDNDYKPLLFYGSGVYFDNRLVMTCDPARTNNGVHHSGLVALNFDEASNLQNNAPPCYEGFWSGLNIFRIGITEIMNEDRAFAFVNGTNGIEFWELMSESEDQTDDINENVSNGITTQCRTPVEWAVESRSDPFGDPDQLTNLVMGSLYIDQITDNVTIVVKWRPDQYPIYQTWQTINLCAPVKQCTPPPVANPCQPFMPTVPQYVSRLTIPQPPDNCALVSGLDLRFGREYQFRLEITGRCRIRGFKVHAEPQLQDMEGTCPPNVQCTALPFCDSSIFTFDSHGTCQSGGVTTYYNVRQCQTAYCPVGTSGNPQTACIEAGVYSSTVSQEDADNQAKAAALTQAMGMLSCTGGSTCANLVPQMTGPSTPSGVASASTQNAILPAWMAFDHTLGSFNRWKSNGAPPQWVQYQFSGGNIVKSYRVHSDASAWQFQGSNDGSTWTTLDTQTGQPDTTVTGGLYLIPNTTSYTYYRMNITAGPGGSLTGFVDVTELELFGCQSPSS